jgi:hypothetical protein
MPTPDPDMSHSSSSKVKLLARCRVMRGVVLSLILPVVSARAHEPEAQRPFGLSHAQGDLSGHFHAGWESRYFSQGRDALDGDSLAASSAEISWQHFSAGLWHGFSPDQNYDETKLSLAVTESLGDFEFYAGYTHLWFPHADEEDNEIGVGLAWSGLPWGLEVAVDGAYAFQADGSFWEVALNREFAAAESLTLTSSAILGLNQGFVADGHDGVNHLAFRLGAEYAISDSWAVTTHAAWSWALNRQAGAAGDENLKDLFHVSVGMQWKF